MSETLFAGIDVGGTNIKYGLIDENGEIRFRSQVQTPPGDKGDRIFKAILTCGEQLLVEADELGGRADFVGVGSPGTIDSKAGVILNNCPNLPGWVGFKLRDRLQEGLNVPVFIDNDANCAALGEFHFGAGKGVRNLICLTIGTGLGCGLILGGRLYRGSNYSAGEIGQIMVPGLMAGQTVRLEEFVSSRGILGRLREAVDSKSSPILAGLSGNNPDRLNIRKVFSAVLKGDDESIRVINDTAMRLGTVLAGLVNVLNPGRIILGGGVAEGGESFVDIVKESIWENSIPDVREYLTVVPAGLGNAAGFIGAAMLKNENESNGN